MHQNPSNICKLKIKKHPLNLTLTALSKEQVFLQDLDQTFNCFESLIIKPVQNNLLSIKFFFLKLGFKSLGALV